MHRNLNSRSEHLSGLQSTTGLVIFAAFSSLPPPATLPQLFIGQRVNIHPAHLDWAPVHTQACTLPEAYSRTHGPLALKPERARMQGEVVGREWAGSLEEEPGGFSLRSHVNAPWQE